VASKTSPADAAPPNDVDALKRAAAERAVDDEVRSGMVVGLGTGTTAIHATRRIGALLSSGELSDIVGVPTAVETADEARRVGIPLLTDDVPWEVDVTIDGADEVDPALDLIKGGGGALLREKLVAQSSAREVIVVDGSKWTERLGSRFPLPVEVVDFGLATTERAIEQLGARVVVRDAGTSDGPFRTDQGNLVLDCHFGPIADAETLAAELASHAGVVEHGLFLGLVDALVIARDAGIEVVRRPDRG
jgi:ribose 5-phosphate isomerase A